MRVFSASPTNVSNFFAETAFFARIIYSFD